MSIGNYGYKDGSGDFFIVIDTDKCGDCKHGCIIACPEKMLILGEDINDPDNEMIIVDPKMKKEIKYKCSPCARPCVSACGGRSGISVQITNNSSG